MTELAAMEPLRVNGISANLIGETERQDRDARPMELRVIAEALDLPAAFFEQEQIGVSAQLDHIERKVDGVLRLLRRIATTDVPLPEAELARVLEGLPPSVPIAEQGERPAAEGSH